MAKSIRLTAFALIPLCAVLTDAVSLADFKPGLQDVPDPCASVYMQDIDGCTPQDFAVSCSRGCISGLVAINRKIAASCSQFDAPSGSLISFFQDGNGIQVLCNVEVVTASTSSSAATSIGESTMSLPSSVPTSSSLIFDTSMAPQPHGSPSSSSSSSSSSPTGILTATGSPTQSQQTPTPSSSSQQVTLATTARPSSSSSTSSSTSTSSAPAVQSESSGNDGSGGDPFATTAGAPSNRDVSFALLTIPLAIAAFTIFSV
ncbi:hypothetical protein NA57DRAFT_52159 [Rhizodiscina lignyota]|uniref:Uncharacterized protein n=1 Tax=Rhizodiscina lignyota TaxID=1504668 RepID=A0A9P4MCM2_9PEZI|nr:hypothetical protein NA57DRAFT_52159 [Rhizodiscina lignyota]